jgi:hypothetical protein
MLDKIIFTFQRFSIAIILASLLNGGGPIGKEKVKQQPDNPTFKGGFGWPNKAFA